MKRSKFILYLLTSIFLLAGVAACGQATTMPTPTSTSVPTPMAIIPAATLQAVDEQRTLTVAGLERTYQLHIPNGLASGQPAPFVLVFHGLEENGAFISQSSGFNEIADANGFIVAYPNGSGPTSAMSWNAGDCCGYAQQNSLDEASFVRQIISDVETITPLDPKRIYVSGFSNGALLSYRLACEMSDTIAAVAPVAGVLVYSPCQPSQPVAVIAFNGLSDTSVPYEGGGMNPTTGQPFPPVQDTITTWATLDGCVETPQVEQDGILTHTSYSTCQNGTAVESYTIQGIGHSWPTPYVVPASQMIWDFFAAHPKQ